MYSKLTGNLLSISMSRITSFSTVARYAHYSCKVLVIGGGTGGCSMAAKLAKKFDKAPNHVIIVEPSEVHYYQPLFTLIGGGAAKFESSKKLMKDVLPTRAQWLKDKVVSFNPNENKIKTRKGDTVEYEVMIVAMGLELQWDKIPGLVEALKDSDSPVCSIYGADTVSKVFNMIKKTKEGNTLFTFPNTPVKCPGAPQKILYLAEDYWCRKKRRNKINVIYNTSLPVIFGVKKYADALWNICKKRNIEVKFQTNLIEIKPEKREAIFQDLANPIEKCTLEYSMLHVTPPMGSQEILRQHAIITNQAGFLDVNPETLQHNKFNNIFGIGDCISAPNSKTMAAIASQSKVLYKNILAHLAGKEMKMVYDGYASCPLVTGYGKCILAEFDYNLKPKETFPVNQSKELFVMYLLKKYGFPFIYWNLMLKGYWNGPEMYRKIFSLIKKKDVVPTTAKS